MNKREGERVLKIAKTIPYDGVNGIGIHSSVFFQGCTHNCKGCFNVVTHNFDGGKEFTYELQQEFINIVKLPYVKGVSILGGEPLQQDLKELHKFLLKIKAETGKPIWLWTGYTPKEIQYMLVEELWLSMLLNEVDVLITGRFIENQKDLTLNFYGSTNQELWLSRVSVLNATTKSLIRTAKGYFDFTEMEFIEFN